MRSSKPHTAAKDEVVFLGSFGLFWVNVRPLWDVRDEDVWALHRIRRRAPPVQPAYHGRSRLNPHRPSSMLSWRNPQVPTRMSRGLVLLPRRSLLRGRGRHPRKIVTTSIATCSSVVSSGNLRVLSRRSIRYNADANGTSSPFGRTLSSTPLPPPQVLRSALAPSRRERSARRQKYSPAPAPPRRLGISILHPVIRVSPRVVDPADLMTRGRVLARRRFPSFALRQAIRA